MGRKKIAVLAGGYSGEHHISMKSALTIMENIDTDLFDPLLIEVTQEAWVVDHTLGKFPVDLNDFSVQVGSDKIQFDFAFIIIHGTPGEDGKVQGYLDMMEVPYSTGGVLNASLTFNKGVTQKVLKASGYNVADHMLMNQGDTVDIDSIEAKIGLPCFVKPARAGSSFGVSKVKEREGLIPAIEAALKVDDQLIIEAFVQGREITCGVLTVKDEVTTLPVTEILFEGEFFDYEAKYNDNSTREVTPADIDEDAYKRCQSLSKEIYRTLHCKGIVRVDYFLLDSGDIYVIEVNAVPGMSAASIVPKMIRNSDMSITEALTSTIETEIPHLQ